MFKLKAYITVLLCCCRIMTFWKMQMRFFQLFANDETCKRRTWMFFHIFSFDPYSPNSLMLIKIIFLELELSLLSRLTLCFLGLQQCEIIKIANCNMLMCDIFNSLILTYNSLCSVIFKIFTSNFFIYFIDYKLKVLLLHIKSNNPHTFFFQQIIA